MAAEPADLDFFLPFPPADADAALAEGIVIESWLLYLFENMQSQFIKNKNSIYIFIQN
jgi:hypothetical protein